MVRYWKSFRIKIVLKKEDLEKIMNNFYYLKNFMKKINLGQKAKLKK